MNNLLNKYRKNIYGNFNGKTDNAESQKGSAIVIALLIMVLLLGFVALAVTRTTNETIASSNDAAESRAFEAAHASLEVMTRNFNKIFDVKLNPDTADLTRIEGQIPPGFENYTFTQTVRITQDAQIVVQTGGEFQGLNSLRDEWQLDTIATDSNGVQVQLRRRFFNNRIPIFQFGIFYDDDLEFHPGPRFDFGGRVHSNGSLFLMAGTGLYFSSKVTAVGEIFTDVARNGSPWTNWNENVFVKNASGSYVQLRNNMGSVLSNPVNGTQIYTDPDVPVVYRSANWGSNENLFQGNLLSRRLPLNLPIKIESQINQSAFDYVEIVKRGKQVGDLWNNGTGTPLLPNIVPVTTANADTDVTINQKYANKSGIRVSLADSKAKLPGCASGVGINAVLTPCGVRLDGDSIGLGIDPLLSLPRGYQPLTMSDGYQATELNGERFYQNSPNNRQVWIKIEAVGFNPATGILEARDITQDILSLGVTEPAPTISVSGSTKFQITGYGNKDSRSIIKLQRFLMPGVAVTATDDTNMTSYSWNGITYNLVLTDDCTDSLYTLLCSASVDGGVSYPSGFSGDNIAHRDAANVDGSSRYRRVVPFPINMFDTREGLFNEDTAVFNRSTVYGSNVPWNGVMSMIDIDIANLKRFLDGNYNTTMPTTTPFAIAAGRRLMNTDIPSANGWVFYVSDRRGDYDFDGEYDMEDIYGNNDGLLQAGEDINNNGRLDTETTNEAPRYSLDGLATSSTWKSYISPSAAAVFDHKFYRRGVRLINGTQLPGTYDSANPLNTRGFTFASENGVYVLGNYNATGIGSVGTPTASTAYLPQNTASHIPASIAADAITILSNAWSDTRSFRYPYDRSNRDATETTIRFAMLAGDARSSKNATPNQGGGDPRLTGGVHNFKRFLEDWGSNRLNYAGSLINLYNSHNNNGAFKCCGTVYNPPGRNWVFDSSFLDPNRLPPGTPFFQAIRLTGFQRLNN